MQGPRFARALGRELSAVEQFDGNWESASVVRTAKQFKLESTVNCLRAEDTRLLTFSAFMRRYPSFPVYLGTARTRKPLDEEPTLLLSALLVSFARTPLAKAYDEFFSSFAGDAGRKPCGVVLNRKGLPGGIIVYSAQATPFLTRPLRDKRGQPAEYVAVSVRRGGGRSVCVASFAAFLAKLEWSPHHDS